jgi:3-oxoacyl-[acyl-carrier protein] reductase
MEMASVFETIQPRYPELKGQVALITGSSRGIGKGVALRLAREGMKIVLHGHDRDELDKTRAEFEGVGAQVISVQADFTQADAIETLFQETLAAFGTLHLLVNNAADLRRQHLFEDRPSLLDHQLAVNVRAPYACAERAAQIMRPAKSGSIVNVSSVGGLRAHWAGLPYDMTKGAIDAMTRAMALDLAREGIRMNAIAPGAVRLERTRAADDPSMQALTGRIPLARMGTAQEMAAVVAFLASNEASYIVGQVIYVDGGITAQLSPPGQPI